ncbi:MAG: type II toxin-antitoxin system RelE family toxin [Candidatus Saliniplasma sp.]
MKFEVLVLPDLFKNISPDREEQIKKALKDLKAPYPRSGRGDKKEIKGAEDTAYRFRIGEYRAFYRIEKEEGKVYVFDILTAEQAHKKYGKL